MDSVALRKAAQRNGVRLDQIYNFLQDLCAQRGIGVFPLEWFDCKSSSGTVVTAWYEEIAYENWFASRPFTAANLENITGVTLQTMSRDQGWADDVTQGSWTWFDICIARPTRNNSFIVDKSPSGEELSWRSHTNRIATRQSQLLTGQYFGPEHELWRHLREGNVILDVFLHLVPHSFTGETPDAGARFVLVEEKRNILIGLAMFGGFAAFFVMEKTLRVLGAEDDSHDHEHEHEHEPAATSTAVNGAPSADGLRQRKKGDEQKHEHVHEHQHATKGPSKLGAYLNLFGDFMHNITDSLAMAASFYSSPLIGVTTTLACFAHEIPHEIADYSILVRAGFSKRQAMASQFATAVGTFVGTFIGIGIHSLATGGAEAQVNLADAVRGTAPGLLGTSVVPGDLVIPFVAGGFLYIGAVADAHGPGSSLPLSLALPIIFLHLSSPSSAPPALPAACALCTRHLHSRSPSPAHSSSAHPRRLRSPYLPPRSLVPSPVFALLTAFEPAAL
ncbi:Zip-domain-containing protein [Auricularia subglabra TFB-10046 SS5]|nr:Zip-domain-containing protein [Auricularia subglabra TFB-10046 SS5]